jgi:hypothetical protein
MSCPPAFFLLSRVQGALDAERETACRGAIHLKIVHVSLGEEFFDGRLEFAVRNVFLREQAPAARIGFKSARASAKFCGKSGVLRIAGARIRVNIDRTGLRQSFNSREAIVGKKDTPIFSWLERTKAVTAGSIVRGDFRMGWESVNRSPPGRADCFRRFGWNGYNAHRLHVFLPCCIFQFQSASAFCTMTILQQGCNSVLSDIGRQIELSGSALRYAKHGSERGPTTEVIPRTQHPLGLFSI